MIGAILTGAGLAILEYFLFFYGNRYFFEGDTIHWFYLRHRSIPEFLAGFLKLDPVGWYRPLTDRTIQSIFYPFFGLEPAGYRVVHYVLFMAAVLAAYQFAWLATKRRMAAGIAAVFFAVHSVNAFVTFDVLFTPEVVYTFFYICAVIAYLRGSMKWSVALFVLSLLSKEAAVTLPAVLVALDVLLKRTPFLRALAAVRAHLLVLAVYGVLVLGYLGVQRTAFQSIVARPGPEIVYRYALDRTILDNADHALTWSFNLPRGWQTESRHLSKWMVTFLKGFRAVAVVLGLWFLFRPERRLILAGLAWFLIAVSPGLPLFEHFLVYYLFLPLVGFSLAIGVIAEAAYRAAPRRLAAVPIVIVFGILTGITGYGARNDATNHRMLGYSSRNALNGLNDLKAAHPRLEPNTTIYFSDAEDTNLSWDLGQGELFKMEYADDSIRSLFWAWGEVVTKGVLESGPVVVMKFSQFHLKEVTREFLAASEPAVSYQPTERFRLAVAPRTAKAGEKYRLSVSGLANTDITIHYSLNGEPVQAFTAPLDEDHQATFDVSVSTRKGIYKIVGFRASDSDPWYQAAASIQID